MLRQLTANLEPVFFAPPAQPAQPAQPQAHRSSFRTFANVAFWFAPMAVVSAYYGYRYAVYGDEMSREIASASGASALLGLWYAMNGTASMESVAHAVNGILVNDEDDDEDDD